MVHIDDIIAKYTPHTTYHINRPKIKQQPRQKVEQRLPQHVPRQRRKRTHGQRRQRTQNQSVDTMARPTLNLVKGIRPVSIRFKYQNKQEDKMETKGVELKEHLSQLQTKKIKKILKRKKLITKNKQTSHPREIMSTILLQTTLNPNIHIRKQRK